jgi:hypothetical protein
MLKSLNSAGLKALTFFVILYFGLPPTASAQQRKKPGLIRLILTSDVHYGIKRQAFRGDTGVNANVVNAAMVKQINTLPALILPADQGVDAGQLVRRIDYLALTGDIANRMDNGVQSSSVSWDQFLKGFRRVRLTGNNGRPAQMLLVPGNHDASNAIGFPRTMSPATDPAAIIGIYNLMMKPKSSLTRQTYDYTKNKVNYSRNIGRVHMMFLNLWPDSAERVWMRKDLAKVSQHTPVVIFTHDPPAGDDKHFSSPTAPNVAAPGNTFEFIVAEHYKEALTPQKGQTDLEQRGWVNFLKQHPNIKAYFHGHSNWNEYYTYKGPDGDVALPVFRVDSPLKGKLSAKDETKLSFQLLSLDTRTQRLTVRECLWNTRPKDPRQGIVFGQTTTISLKVE